MYERLLPPPQSSFFLFGARGTGKTTWSRACFPDAHRVDLLDEARYQELLVSPGILAAELRAFDRGSWVVIDEVQRLPNLLNEVHRAIEDRGLRFGLLGSSARKLRAAGVNLLAGRALRRALFGLLPAELGGDFDIEEVLRYGSLPLVKMSSERRETLDAYVRLYLREEVQAEALVRNLPGFARFLQVAALAHGQLTNVSSIARDAAVSRSTVAGYLDVLEDTLLVTRLSAYEAKLRVRERKHPKLYWIDPGVVRAAKSQTGPVADEERGALLEGWLLSVLRAYNEFKELYEEIHYWAPAQGGVEVDFVLRRGREFLAVEVKSQRRFTSSLTKGLRAIVDLPGIVRRILVYRGDRILVTEDGIDVWPVERFVEAVDLDELWPA